MSNIYNLESTADLLPALDKLHELIQLMQGIISSLFFKPKNGFIGFCVFVLGLHLTAANVRQWTSCSSAVCFWSTWNPATGVSESEPHWVYCSKFLLGGLNHLTLCLEQLDERDFLSAEEYLATRNITNLLVRKAEMVFTSHLAYWWAHTHTHAHAPMHTHAHTRQLGEE